MLWALTWLGCVVLLSYRDLRSPSCLPTKCSGSPGPDLADRVERDLCALTVDKLLVQAGALVGTIPSWDTGDEGAAAIFVCLCPRLNAVHGLSGSFIVRFVTIPALLVFI